MAPRKRKVPTRPTSSSNMVRKKHFSTEVTSELMPKVAPPCSVKSEGTWKPLPKIGLAMKACQEA